jgi:hypothetical protein
MRQLAIFTIIGMSCAGCGMIGPPPAELAEINIRVDKNDPNCRDWTLRAQVNLRQENLVGHGCRTPDGGWQVTEGTARNPSSFDQHVSAATAAKYPWNSGPPVGISTGRTVVYYDFVDPPLEIES